MAAACDRLGKPGVDDPGECRAQAARDKSRSAADRGGEGKPAQSYVYLRSLQTRDNEPFGYARVHLARHLYAKTPKSFSSRAALVVLAEMKGLAISRAHQTFTIGAADIETAKLLDMSLNAPTAEARCVVTDDDGIVVYVGEITYRGDCVRINIELRG